ncbi:MAG TPA: PDZ domain-containing protein, partial [Acidimicrobiales bacterium]|nr:PDZ domain-containing protein [Acidimicrobiales bacterium]
TAADPVTKDGTGTASVDDASAAAVDDAGAAADAAGHDAVAPSSADDAADDDGHDAVVPSSADGTGPAGPAGHLGPGPVRHPRRRGRVALVTLGFLLVAFVAGAALVPLPYYLFRPGSVRDTEPLITVEGTEVYASDGSIGYTTVSLRQASLFGLMQGWINDDIDIYGRDRVLQGRNVSENRAANLQMMDDSKQVATQVALERLGYDVDVTVGQTVAEVAPELPADGLFEVGDTITAIDGEAFDDAGDLRRLLADDPPGDTVSATYIPRGGGGPKDVQVALAADPDEPTRGVMGVSVVPQVLHYDFPVEVSIDTGDVGGPSAGLAFTLAIIDDLTPGDLTGGADIAVTGTISGDGTVGEVGGTGQKAAAVRDAGMSLFLVPSADYEDAVAHAGDDLEVVAVDSLDEALAALAERGGNADDLPQVGQGQGGSVAAP